MTNEKNDLTAGSFQAMTGLTAKALRLYAERGILAPASVDPDTGYRRYARSQLQHGMTTDLLRRAQVPLSELASATSFPFDQWRETVETRPHLEDFCLAVAEHVTTFDPADFTAHASEAPALDWVGVVIDLDVPEDIDGRIEAFTGLAVETPAVGKAFGEALTDLGVGPADVCWTAVPETTTRSGGGQLLLARPGPAHLGAADREHIAGRVRSSTGQSVVPVTGTLPPRVEITFTAAITDDPTPVEEAAAGYLHVLAFEDYVGRRRLTAVLPTARQVVHAATWFSFDAVDEPASVFDVLPPAPVA
ncbi:MerR HTH family regulatory protein [Promicromonospora umidemergens]|uniref:HTH merR-type domain-containing protein n=1 Tax=Promicromonospora umidemergens TaxID=629679 RepID=A0ABP8XX71_9MICO|nr:MerR family DNA-binding transcriptional regulator [Promicromonospora umidemergens]MCP2286018.1 MerR HTH family regulatory protein [Promicromonospora umidemergens]